MTEIVELEKGAGGKLWARRGATILFSIVMGSVTGLLGMLAGGSLWERFGARPDDELMLESVAHLAGMACAVVTCAVSLRLFWPRSRSQQKNQARSK